MTPSQLKDRRHALRLTQKQAAAALGVALRTYQYWEASADRELPFLVEAGLEKLETERAA